MLFNIFTAALMGLSTLAAAAAVPTPPLVPQSIQRRHLDTRFPKDHKDNKDNKDVKIIDTTVVALSESSRNSEVQLIVAIQQTEIIRNGCNNEKRKLQDRIRHNHFRNKNKDVNTVIIVITNIIDIRDSNKKNNRYMRRVINNRGRNKNDKNNKNNNRDVTVQITEVVAITIDSSNSNSKSKNDKNKDDKHKDDKNKDDKHKSSKKADKKPANALATATASAIAAIQTVDANAPFLQSNSSILLPDGSPAPSFSSVDLDPARILESDNEDAFVG